MVPGSAVIWGTPSACSAPSGRLRTQGTFPRGPGRTTALQLCMHRMGAALWVLQACSSFLAPAPSGAPRVLLGFLRCCRRGGAGCSAPPPLGDVGCHVHHLGESKEGGKAENVAGGLKIRINSEQET